MQSSMNIFVHEVAIGSNLVKYLRGKCLIYLIWLCPSWRYR
jgi:hypothetical protein